MVEGEFEGELHALYDQTAPAADSRAFGSAVEGRIAARPWLRRAIVLGLGLGLAGLLVAWLSLGLSANDLTGGLAAAAAAVTTPGALESDSLWAAGMMVLVLAWLLAPLLLEER
jgi:hypothetical protein